MSTRRPAKVSAAPGKIRIIGGQWKRTPLAVPNLSGLRPTPDRVRETVFNWLFTLRGELDGARCLDLFAGTGAMGLEAASRGAAHVTLVEHNAVLVAALRAAAHRLNASQLQMMQGDALSIAQQLARSAAHSFDVVFLDPPYAAGLLPQALRVIKPLLAAQAVVYVEDQAALTFEGWQVLRHAQAGAVHYGLLQCDNP
jgi:16S rRNA (guanine966-N2)-methyltransferase